jgi:hypothetical protein
VCVSLCVCLRERDSVCACAGVSVVACASLCVSVCVREKIYVSVRACVRACVRVCVRACERCSERRQMLGTHPTPEPLTLNPEL